MSALNGQVAILVNHAYNLADQITFDKVFLLVQDVRRLKELGDVFRKRTETKLLTITEFDVVTNIAINNSGSQFVFFPPKMDLRLMLRELKPRTSLSFSFSSNPLWGLYTGQSVIFSAIQWAYFMGARQIVLLGVDMERPTGNVASDYAFQNVHEYNQFLDYEIHAKPHLIVLRDELSKHGVELLNATAGGRIDVLRRVTLEEVIGRQLGDGTLRQD